MSLPIINHICQSLLKILPGIEGLDKDKRTILEKRIKEIADLAINKDKNHSLTERFHLEDFEDVIEKQRKKVLLSRILRDVLRDSSPDLTEKVKTATKSLFKVSFAEKSDPLKEGRAKEYAKKHEALAADHPTGTFKSLKKENLTPKILSETFSSELTAAYKASYGKTIFYQGKESIKFLTTIFEEALSETTEKVLNQEISPQEAVHYFFKTFKPNRDQSIHRESISKDTFRDLVGERVPGGRGRKSPLDTQHPAIKGLIEEYTSGTWKDGENREIIKEEMTQEERKKSRTTLAAIFNEPEFIKALEGYFKTLL